MQGGLIQWQGNRRAAPDQGWGQGGHSTQCRLQTAATAYSLKQGSRKGPCSTRAHTCTSITSEGAGR